MNVYEGRPWGKDLSVQERIVQGYSAQYLQNEYACGTLPSGNPYILALQYRMTHPPYCNPQKYRWLC